MYPAKSMLPFPSGTMSAQKEERLKPCSTVGKVDSQSGDSQQPSFAGKSTVNLQHSCKPLLAPHLQLTISYSSYPTPWSNFPFSSSPSQLVYSVYSFRRAGCRAVYANCRPNFFAFSAWMARSRRWVTCCDLMPMMPAPGPGRSRRAGARQI